MNRQHRCTLLSACLFLLLLPPFALQGQAPPFARLQQGQELSQHSVTAIAQDRLGFLWIGTKEGLNRFDGYGMRPYIPDIGSKNSLKNGQVNAMYTDREGRLWVGTDGGLSLYSYTYDCFANYKDGLGSLSINAICQANDSSLWVGTEADGLYLFSPKQGVFAPTPGTRFKENPSLSEAGNSIKALAVDKQAEALWVGTGSGLCRLDLKTGKYTAVNPSKAAEQQPVNSLCLDSKGQLWVGYYGGGLYRKNSLGDSILAFEEFTGHNSLKNGFINAIAEGAEGRVWVATSNGLKAYHPSSNSFWEYHQDSGQGLTHRRVQTLFKDRQGILWVGTVNGINFSDPYQKIFKSAGKKSKSPVRWPNNSIQAICPQTNRGCWLGTEQGLAYFSLREDTVSFYPLKGAKSQNITCLLNYSESQIWIGNNQGQIFGLGVSGGQGLTQSLSEQLPGDGHSINDMLRDGQGSVWIATEGGGLKRWSEATKNLSVYKQNALSETGLPSNFISTLALSRKNEGIWAGTYGGGVVRVDQRGRVVEHFRQTLQDSATINSNLINALWEDGRGYLWVGSQAGLNSIDLSSGKVKSWQLGKKQVPYVVKSIAQDRLGHLWIGTNKGLVRLQVSAGEVRAFDEKDGLPSTVFHRNAVAHGPDGQMLFGSFSGLAYFQPDSICQNPYSSPVHLIRLFVENKEVSAGPPTEGEVTLDSALLVKQQLALNHSLRAISFEFAALNYRLPEKNLYRYKLTPFQKKWVYKSAQQREATYTNLPPGEYRFIVEATDNRGHWQKVGRREIRLTIPTPLISRWWVRLLMLLAVSSLVFIGYRFRTASIERSRQQLAKQVKSRTQELQEKTQELETKAQELEAQKQEVLQVNEELGATNDQLAIERKKSEAMLLNMLPKEAAKEIKESGSYTPRYYKSVSILFTDFKGFTSIAAKLSPQELLEELDYFFQYFDKIAEKHGLEKIKTIGDTYMCAGGVPQANHTNPVNTVLAGLEILAFSKRSNQKKALEGRPPWVIQVGIHTGPVVAGVVGKKKFAYDIWGEAVNIAALIEVNGSAEAVNISEYTYHLVKDFFECQFQKEVLLKGRGESKVYRVLRIKPELSLEGDGLSPNAAFRSKLKSLPM